MSLINRIAIANLSNTKGVSESEWSPRYRYEILSFDGQSAVVNLANGGGKTTMANAIIALLSRHQGLLKQTKEHAAPSRLGVYSHVQIELVTPTGHVGQRDLVTEGGGAVTGEKWVFGMAMHSEGDNIFYHYPGVLEDCPPASRDEDGRLCLTQNAKFESMAKAVKGIEWGVGREAWKTRMSLHIPHETLMGIAEFQVKGGADKDAPIFKLTQDTDEDGRLIRESLDQRFFYKILAPELLSDVFEWTEGDEEKSADQHLFEEARGLVKTRHILDAKRKEVDQMEIAMDLLREAADAGDKAVAAKSQYDEALKGHELDMAVLHDMVQHRPIPGVPNPISQDSKVGEIASHLVVVPGESAPKITDAGLAVILAKPHKEVNRIAKDLAVIGQKKHQAIENPSRFVPEISEKRRYSSTLYDVQKASHLLQVQGGNDAVSLLEEAIEWFDRADTNPYRETLAECEFDQEQAAKSKKELSIRIERLQQEAVTLSNARKEVEANQHAYNTLVASRLFTDDELAAPSRTKEQVEAQHQKISAALKSHQTKKASLDDLVPDWEQYQAEYAGHDPSQLRDTLIDKKKRATAARNENETQILELENAKNSVAQKLSGLNRRLSEQGLARKQHAALAERAALAQSLLEPGESILGLESAIQTALAQANKDLSTCQQTLSEVRAGLKTIATFKQHHPDDEPAEWIHAATQRRYDLISEQSRLTTELANLRRERWELDSNPVAASEVSDKGLKLLDEADVPHQNLHSFVTGLGLPDSRLQDILGMFSSLLFAPVVDVPGEALRAADLLGQKNLPIPVFQAESLRAYCLEKGGIEALDTGRLGLLAGQVTRQVECIMDPGLVEREKQDLDKRIDKSEGTLKAIAGELEDLDPEGKMLTLARAAAQAVANGFADLLPELEGQETTLENEIQIHESRLTDENVALMRDAEKFENEGGLTHLEKLTETLERLQVENAELEAKAEQIDADLQSRRDRRSNLEAAIETAFPDDTRQRLEQVIRFVDRGGPDFMANAEARETKLTQEYVTADKRRSFSHDFGRAQDWLDYREELGKEESVDERIKRNQQQIEDAKTERKVKDQVLRELEQSLPRQREKVDAIDQAALALLEQFRKSMTTGSTQHGIQVPESDIDDHPLGIAAWRYREAVENEQVIDASATFIEAIESLDLDVDLSRIRNLGAQATSTEREFVNKANAAASIEYGLSDIERQRLQEAKGVDYAHRIKEVAEEYWKHFVNEKDELETLGNDEKAINEDFSSRIAMLLESANDNLSALKNVAKENPKGMVSHFIVEASVAKRDELGGIVRKIVDLVDISEQQRQHMEKLNLESGSNQKALLSQIQNILYRGIFTRVSVKFANQHIRPGGKPERLSKNLSTGQKNALLMMWVLRLAQYRIEREARKRHSTVARKRARTQSQSIMIIDGLFSNLTEPNLIHSVMSSLTGTRGSFQLIGLVHDPKYQHDFDLFPTFLIGNTQNAGSWVNIKRVSKSEALAFAKVRVERRHAS